MLNTWSNLELKKLEEQTKSFSKLIAKKPGPQQSPSCFHYLFHYLIISCIHRQIKTSQPVRKSLWVPKVFLVLFSQRFIGVDKLKYTRFHRFFFSSYTLFFVGEFDGK